MNLSGKVFAITGASRGIGAALAIALCQAGAKVALGARNLTHLKQIQEECLNQGGEALTIPLDVSQKEQCQTFIEQTIQTYGRLDGLINNAGITLIAKFEDITDLSYLVFLHTNYDSLGCGYSLDNLVRASSTENNQLTVARFALRCSSQASTA